MFISALLLNNAFINISFISILWMRQLIVYNIFSSLFTYSSNLTAAAFIFMSFVVAWIAADMKRSKKHLKIVKEALINRSSLTVTVCFSKSLNNFHESDIFIILFCTRLSLLTDSVKSLRAIYWLVNFFSLNSLKISFTSFIVAFFTVVNFNIFELLKEYSSILRFLIFNKRFSCLIFFLNIRLFESIREASDFFTDLKINVFFCLIADARTVLLS